MPSTILISELTWCMLEVTSEIRMVLIAAAQEVVEDTSTYDTYKIPPGMLGVPRVPTAP